MVRHNIPPVALHLTRSESFLLHVQHFSKCHRMHLNVITPDSYELHLWIIHLTCTYILGTLASFRVIQALRRSFSTETLVCGPCRSTPYLSPYEG